MNKIYGVVVALAATLMGAILLLERTAAAASPTGIKNVVLVHGAFADGSGWEAVVKILEKDGYTEKYLGEVDKLSAPLLMRLGEEDEFISKAAQAQIKAALANKANATVYSYPGQHHAFARHNGTHYNAAAAALANGRTSEFRHQPRLLRKDP